MPSQLALAIAVAFIGWLFTSDRKRGNPFSSALWIPLLWLLLIGSRPLSLWFPNAEFTGNAIDGSPFDRNVFLGLFLGGLIVLLRRGFVPERFFGNNTALIVFFLYLGLSSVWSDFPFVAFKRWIKDVGNLIMVLIVLTEPEPEVAVRSLLARCAYVIIPLSVVFIRYFPDIGRYYNRFIWSYSYGGVTLDKNMLGSILVVSSFGLFLSFLECRRRGIKPWFILVLAVMNVYLYLTADCSTALVTTVLGISGIACLRLQFVKARVERFGYYAFAAVAFLFLAHVTFNIGELLVGAIGRDMTLTGRTDIWKLIMNVDFNPLIGVGYWSFWMGNRVDWTAEGYMGELLEAHNGYIETYINSGLVGVLLLLILLVSSFKRACRGVVKGADFEGFKLSFLLVAVLYNVTESIFNRFGPIWFIMLLAVIYYPVNRNSRSQRVRDELPGDGWERSHEPSFS